MRVAQSVTFARNRPEDLYITLTLLLLIRTKSTIGHRVDDVYIIYIYRYGKKGRPKSITCPEGARSPSRSIILCACVCVFIYLATTIYINIRTQVYIYICI